MVQRGERAAQGGSEASGVRGEHIHTSCTSGKISLSRFGTLFGGVSRRNYLDLSHFSVVVGPFSEAFSRGTTSFLSRFGVVLVPFCEAFPGGTTSILRYF